MPSAPTSTGRAWSRLSGKNGYTFPVLFADPGVQSDYDVRSIPITYLVDRKGRLRFAQTGYGPDTETELDWALEQLLGR